MTEEKARAAGAVGVVETCARAAQGGAGIGTGEDLVLGRVDVRGRKRSERSDAFGAARRRDFLDALARTCSVEQASRDAGVCSSLVYKHRRTDHGFAEQWVEALKVGYDQVEGKVLGWVLSGGNDSMRASADPAAAGSGGGLVFGQAPGWVQVALHLLNRHRPTLEGRAQPMRTGRTASAEETDAALTRRLDQLARALARGAIKPVGGATVLMAADGHADGSRPQTAGVPVTDEGAS